jgi:hypothetical protein
MQNLVREPADPYARDPATAWEPAIGVMIARDHQRADDSFADGDP